jgi:uncharacterized repeat protein (TIGR01451 family)
VKPFFHHSLTSRLNSSRNWFVGSLLVSSLCLGLQPAHAEGSRSLISGPGATGRRPYLEYRNDLTGGIPRRTSIFVYAEATETLNLGSSAHGIGAGTIQFTAPNGVTTSCDAPTAANNFAGQILDVDQEQAGPSSINAQGYTPCQVPVGQTGIWRIEFTSPNTANPGDPPPIAATANWTQQTGVSWIAAWDVTVTNAVGAEQTGRAYANYLPLTIGANLPSPLTSQTFVLTIDGYLYRIQTNGLDPYSFIFFANNKGFRDANGNSLFRSVPLQPTPSFQRPDLPDDGNNVTHKIFFNRPAATLPANAILPGGTTWLQRVPPVTPPLPSNFNFVGQEGTPNQAGTVPLTGNFTFDSPNSGGYSITIDINQNNVYGDANDRVLLGTADIGTNTVTWDGRDGNGNPVPASSAVYGAEITLNAGEVHFPIFDPENNPNGLIIERLVPAGGDVFRVFYDDSVLTGAGATSPIRALSGINSSTGAHGFTNNFGDQRGIDTWANLPSAPLRLAAGVRLAQADLAIVKTNRPTSFTAGAPVTYTLTVTNNGPSDVTGARVLDTVPATITGVTWTCAVTTGTGSCGAANGSGNAIDTTVNLNNGAIATYTITGTLSPTATGNITNTATVLRPNDVTDPNDVNRTGAGNNSASIAVPILPPAPRIGVAKQAGTVVDNRDDSFTVPYTIRVTNLGNFDLSNLQIVDDLAATFRGAVSFSVASPPISPTLTTNRNYNGTSDTNLLAGTDTLPIGTTAIVTFNVRVTPGTNLGPYDNSATGIGTPPNAAPIQDTSNDGVNPDPNNDGDPGDNSIPTPVSFSTTPRLRLVKRITAVSRRGILSTFNNFVDDPNDVNDNAAGWSQLSPVGVPAIDTNNPLRSGDEVEYTIYYLADGGLPLQDVNWCDTIATGTAFLPNSFGAGLGVTVNTAGTTIPRTNQTDADNVTVYSPLAPLPTGNACSDQSNPNGAVTVNLGTISNVAGSNFGFIRFRVQLD